MLFMLKNSEKRTKRHESHFNLPFTQMSVVKTMCLMLYEYGIDDYEISDNSLYF